MPSLIRRKASLWQSGHRHFHGTNFLCDVQSTFNEWLDIE